MRATGPAIPVAPGRLPVLGHSLALARRPLEFVTSLPALGGLVRVHIGPTRALFVNDPELLHRVLVTDAAKFGRGRIFDKARRFFGDSVVTASGASHRGQRRLLQPNLQRDRVEQYAQTIRDLAQATAQSWRAGQTVALTDEMDDLSIQILTRTVFAAPLDEQTAARLRHGIDVVLRGAALRAALPGVLGRLPTPANRRFEAAVTALRSIVAELVAADDGGLATTLQAAHDLRTGQPLTQRQIHDAVIAILVAGTDSTAATMAWAFHELGQSPAAEARLHEEIDATPTVDAAARLPYTERVIAETLRLHSVWLIMRRALVPVDLGDTRVPAGAEILYSLYAMHRNAALFPEPDRFDPDRWSPDRTPPARHTFLPFGAGAHRCLGEHFGMAETRIALATIARTWRLRPVPGHRVREVASAVVHPDHLPMRVEPRPSPPA